MARTKEIVEDAVSSRYQLTETGRSSYLDYVSFLEDILRRHGEKQEKT